MKSERVKSEGKLRIRRLFPASLVAIFLLCACGSDKRDAIGQTEVLIETTEGDIVVRLYDDTPLHRDNFIHNVQAGAYDGILFNRIVSEMVIQAGDTTLKMKNEGVKNEGMRNEIGTEETTGKRETEVTEKQAGVPAEIVYPRHFHKQGALAAAREPDSINAQKESSTMQWYIVTGKKYTSGELAELQATLYEARTTALFEQLQRQHAAELSQLKATDYAAHQERLNQLLLEAEETMAANPPRPFNEAQKQAYTKIGGAPHLDGEYTVFGEVVEGMPIAARIGRTPTDSHERPRRAVGIKRIVIR